MAEVLGREMVHQEPPPLPESGFSMPLLNGEWHFQPHHQRPPTRISGMSPFKMGSKVQLGMHRPTSTSERVSFVRRKGRYYPAKQTKLKNSLLAGVGFLELANAMDFPANVWNTIPVPVIAVAMMGIGGTVALAISLFALQDAILSRRNILLLRDERRYLKQRKASLSREQGKEPELDIQLDVSFREIGTEIIDRIGMDSCMGFGAILVAVGTYMAIGGANPNVFMASNLLSGYIGNTPSAIYGAVNAGWSIYVWRRAHRQALAGARHLRAPDVWALQKERISTIKMHASLNGLTGLVSGTAGIITATRWWGYVVLIPCIASAIYCNTVWRRRLGYERPSILQSPSVDRHETVEEIRLAALAQKLLKETPWMAFNNLVPNTESISCVMDFIVMHGFFEDFCIHLLKDTDLTTALLGSSDLELEIDSSNLLMAEKSFIPRLLEIAETTIRETGLARFRDRQRFLLEKLGCQLRMTESKTGGIKMSKMEPLDIGPKDTLASADISIASSSRGEDVESDENKPSGAGAKDNSASSKVPITSSVGDKDVEMGGKETPEDGTREVQRDPDVPLTL